MCQKHSRNFFCCVFFNKKYKYAHKMIDKKCIIVYNYTKLKKRENEEWKIEQYILIEIRIF